MRVSHSGRGLHNVPAEVTSFIGRQSELTEVKRLLSTTRLLTLTGPGGVGKTRLALQAARHLERAFPDGVWLVELAALRDPALLTQVVSTSFGLREQSTRWEIATLNDFLRDQQLLLVLDNCEHLLDACAILADGVLHACPEVRIMTTSRQPLGIRGETTLTVPSLSLPDAKRPPADKLIAYEAIGLFAERAAAAVPGFKISSANEAAVIQLCRRLDGIPLAIELATVRLKALGVEQILDRLDDRFTLLRVGNRTALPRHQTLEATIQWSFDLLSESEKTLWVRLAVFAGSFDVDAVEDVCSGDGIERADVFDLLTGLLDKSIVMRHQVHERVRYSMLETIRQFGVNRMRSSEQEATLRRRHRDWVRSLLDDDGDWMGVNQRARFDRLESDHDNLRAALDFCLTEPGEADRGLAMAAYLWPYWQGRGHLREGRRWIDALLAADPPPVAARARGLAAAGNLALMHGDIPAATSFLEQGRAQGRQDRNGAVTSFCLTYLGLGRMFQGDLIGAVSRLEEALAMQRAANEPSAVASTLGVLAMTRLLQGERSHAISLWNESRAISLELGDQWVLSYTLWGLGIALWMEGDPVHATAVEKEALQLKCGLDERLGIALCLETLAWIAMSRGAAKRATCLLGAARATWDATGGSLFEAFRHHRDQCEADCRKALRGAFDAAFQKGSEMPLDEAAADALEARSERAQPTMEIAASATALSRRERQIAQLVAEGLTNKEIAAKLVLSERTAETHVQNILNKLGFRSRSEVAAWVTSSTG